VKLGINEELWYGDDAGEEAEKRAAKSMAARMGRIIGTKPFPVAAQRLTVLTQNPDCSMDEVVAVLESDPALSARLLRLVNSAGFALRTACTSVRHAATLVGTEKLNQIASTAAILDMYGKSGVHAAVILEHATAVGALCRYLAFHFSLPPDDLFTCGFLHDIGKLMMIETEGDEYVELIKKHSEFDTAYVVERERYGFDHALLAGHVLTAWNIPHPVPKVVAWHHHITRAYADSTLIAQMVSTLRLADAMSFAFSEPDQKLAIERLSRMEASSYMDISEAQLAAMWDEVKALTTRARAIFRGEDPPEINAPPEVIQSGKPSQQSLRAVASGRQSLRSSSEPGPSISVRPQSSLRAPSALDPGPVSIRPGAHSLRSGVSSEPQTPRQFPCVVCDAPSFAQTCAACHGYVCPMHVGGEDEWCQLCQDAYRDTGIPHVGPGLSVVLGAGLGILVAAAFFGAASAGAQQPLRLMLGPTLVMTLLGMLVGISQRWVRRWWFLRSRPNRSLDHRKTVEDLLSSAQQAPRIVEIRESDTSPEPAQVQRTTAEPVHTSEALGDARPQEIEREPDLSPAATRSAELRSGSLPPPPKATRRSSPAARGGGKRLESALPKIPAAPALPGPDILPPVLSTPPPPSNRNKLWMSKSPLTGNPEVRDSLPPSSPRPQPDAALDQQSAGAYDAAQAALAASEEPRRERSDTSGLVRASDLARDAGVTPVTHTQKGPPPPAPAASAEPEQPMPITLPSQPPPPLADEQPLTRLDGRKSSPPPASSRSERRRSAPPPASSRGDRRKSAPPVPAHAAPRTLNGIPAPVPISEAYAVSPAPGEAAAPPAADGALTPASAWTQVLESQGTADGW
jgi:HD-like signal output (HDOD) protein